VSLLQENPQILLNLGESNVEDSAEVGTYAMHVLVFWCAVVGKVLVALHLLGESNLKDSAEVGADVAPMHYWSACAVLSSLWPLCTH
jgi:hypothetical protein